MSNEVVEPWASAMVAAGLTDPRYKKREVPSMRRLAEAAETYTSTISHMMAGTRETGSDVVDRVADALEVDRTEVAGWVGRARTAPKLFKPHRDADLLTSEEQEAVNEMIRLLALAKKREGGAEDDSPAATKLGGGVVTPMKRATPPARDKDAKRRSAEAARRTNKPTAKQREDQQKADDNFEPS